MHKISTTAPALLAALTLSGCMTLQPTVPDADTDIGERWPLPESFEEYQTNEAAGSDFQVESAAEIGWRDFFTDAKLREVISLALENNRDLRVAVLNVDRTRSQYRIQRADRIPSVNGSVGLTRTGGDGAQQEIELYEAELGITQFELDLLGRVKSLSDAALQQYFASEENRRSAQLSLIAQVANSYLTLAADQELLRLAEETLANYQEVYDITKRRFDLGSVSALDLSQSRTILASAKADVSLYQGQVAQDTSALNLLVGTTVAEDLLPGDFVPEVSGVAALPFGLPSEVLLRRPDVRSAENQLLAANANIGAARAALFPSISLTGTVGTASGDLSDLFSSGTDTWSFIPQISVPIFQSGRLRANKRVAEIDQEIALANYETAIRVGFKEVVDSLTLTKTLEERGDALREFLEAAQETQDLSQERYDAGADSYLTLLDAQRTLYGARQTVVQAQLQEQANRINLYKVLGGGWNE